jgi:UDP-glucuronate 4-epimerase
MNILVTGGAGFIGSHFVELLLGATDARIIALDDFNDFYWPAMKRANIAGFSDNPRVTVVEGSFLDDAELQCAFRDQRPTHVVHLGAHAGVRRSVHEPVRYARNNVEGTTCLLEVARRHPVERFILASSSTVYGRGTPTPFREDGPLGIPMSPYGASKRGAELMGFAYRDLFGVPVTCVRPFSVYGPRLRPDLAMSIFSHALWTGRKIPLYGDGSIRRDFTHVRDICQGLLAALTAPGIEGEAINLGHDEPLEMRQAIASLAGALDREPEIEYLPGRAEDLPATHADLTKARRLLGYRPEVPFSEGVREFAAWFRSTVERFPQAYGREP